MMILDMSDSVSIAQMRCYKWLFLLCLLGALGFMVLSYLPTNVGLASNWATRNGLWQLNGVLDTVDRHSPRIATNEGGKTTQMLKQSSQVKKSTRSDEVTSAQPTRPPDKQSTMWFLNDDTYTKSKCLSAIRRNPELVPGGLNFIPDIPVLMWSEHINPEEYDRLKLFDRLFGWKNIPYGDVKNCLRHFNTSDHRYMFPGWTPDHAGCVRCAVVGNGGILRGSGKGREIDGHDFVWRVNAAITEGFEDDVGKRTSFYFHCHNSLKNSLKTSRKYGFTHPPQDKSTVYISVAKNVQDYAYFDAAISWKPVKNKSSPPLEYGERPANTKFRMLHPDFIRYLTYNWLNSSRANGRYENIYQPSKGAIMLLTALHTCDITDAYGFITADHRHYNSYYYEKDWKKYVFYANHDFRMELELWNKLDIAGLMTLYRGNKTDAEGGRE
ncbi:alpha-N-acetylgalactosaminide alpha-2,6-sialyltransferase 2-like isoform X2 [Branchiostoma lanceolatum]|uniref:alpha-N-acetylgalactosaminide alpha-2,6-sialyltransferase 2-like isoform X2 n=1 Tax=Branchiostoma lanceolatum TaxID=7740 RepID=UPI00345132C5